MAYAAVSSLLQTLQRLLQFPCILLQVKKLHIEMLFGKIREIQTLFDDFSSSNYRESTLLTIETALRGYKMELGYLILNLMLDDRAPLKLDDRTGLMLDMLDRRPSDVMKQIRKRLIYDVYHRTPKTVEKILAVLEEVPKMLQDNDCIEAGVKRFSHDMTECISSIDNSSSDSWLQPSFLQLIRQLKIVFRHWDSQKLKREINSLNAEAMRIMDLSHDLGFLLGVLADSANEQQNHEEEGSMSKCISNVVNKAENCLEELLLDYSIESSMRTLVTGELGLRMIIMFSRTLSKVMFDEQKGIQRVLLSTSQEIDSIKVKLKKINGDSTILGIKELQAKDTSMEGSRHDFRNQDIVVGLDDISNDIVDRLTLTGQIPKLEIVTITGMPGIGKTTLARKVFKHPYTAHYFYCHGWVTVSQVYRVRDLLLGLLCSVTQPTDDIFEKKTEKIAEYLYRSLKDKRYLIVMDDIWTVKAFDDVKKSFPDDRNGSRIVLTSRLKSVAISLNPKSPPYCLSLLSIDESWKLLQEKVFGKESCPPEFTDVGKQIVKKCQGLPLSIVVVAGHLSRISKTIECWKDIADNINSLVITDPEQCFEILALSYNHLPNHLKACYLYMGVFPEDCDIEVNKLINLWIAEGFLDLKSTKCLEEVGENYLEDLVDRSLVLVGKRSFNGKIKTCSLHDLLRELCLREAKKQSLMHVIRRDSLSFPDDINKEYRVVFHFYRDFYREIGSVLSVPSMRSDDINKEYRVGFHFYRDFYREIGSVLSVPSMRSFLCFSVGSGYTPNIFFSYLCFKLLRVLDISFLRFDNFPVQILNLVLLRYLALVVTYELPAQISELGNLQTLIIHGPWIKKQSGKSRILSLAYWHMPWLRHLYISVASCLRHPSIAKSFLANPLAFKDLRALCTINLRTLAAIQLGSCSKEVFEVMPYLKKLEIYESKGDYNAERSFYYLGNLVYLQQLETLKCSFYKRNRITRQKVCWDAFPSTLKKLSLSSSYLPWKDMTSIARLPNLEVLKLKNYAFHGFEWEPKEDDIFLRLKYLLIEETDLKWWIATRDYFPVLRHLLLRTCDFLEEIPFSIVEIPTLELIELHDCSESAELSAEEIKEQVDGVDVHIFSERVKNKSLNKKPLTS
ncbi:hypothetical protein M9H77_24531 [Catharanthus roseus]|uniref:Uncharacterized protein n=1 Tax=Catharanthus roseus TaxID=4058 RepID=A0ACC0AZ62_CATRO|nr:hypothetical protein M9H77_24531 [Catharanthus roseus]